MHGEAFTYTRQTLGFPASGLPFGFISSASGGPFPGDAEVPGARFNLGATDHAAFVFDNEKWGHEVDVSTFQIARAPVTNEEFARFVEASGYDERAFWSEDGWRWRVCTGARHPIYWRPIDRGFAVRRYDSVVSIAPHQPIVHVCFHEAEAYCWWAKRRLPTEAEWELAASTPKKRRLAWGDDAPTGERANLDGSRGGPVDVAAFAEGDSAYGCRQMIGNVWEWTSSDFAPFPGFIADPYKEYSELWFPTPHKVAAAGQRALASSGTRGAIFIRRIGETSSRGSGPAPSNEK